MLPSSMGDTTSPRMAIIQQMLGQTHQRMMDNMSSNIGANGNMGVSAGGNGGNGSNGGNGGGVLPVLPRPSMSQTYASPVTGINEATAPLPQFSQDSHEMGTQGMIPLGNGRFFNPVIGSIQGAPSSLGTT